MSESEYICPNCGAKRTIDSDGDRLQSCPECGFRDMVKEPQNQDIHKK